jgi:putative FmdB family regulatory protein
VAERHAASDLFAQQKRRPMPTYEYMCSDCGPFTQMRPMAESDLGSECPHCGDEAPRAFLTPPNFSGMSSELRVAHATNERSRHAPVSSASKGHGSGCSCCSGKGLSRKTLRRKDGSKSFPTSRPWMISH